MCVHAYLCVGALYLRLDSAASRSLLWRPALYSKNAQRRPATGRVEAKHTSLPRKVVESLILSGA